MTLKSAKTSTSPPCLSQLKTHIRRLCLVLSVLVFSLTSSCSIAEDQASNKPGTQSHMQRPDVPSVSIPLTDHRNSLIQQLVAEKKFVEIFSKAATTGHPYMGQKDNYIVTDAVTAYLERWGNSQQETLALFKQSGFNVKDVSTHLEYHRKNGFPDADQIFIAKRAASPVQPNQITYLVYQVIIGFKQGHVQHLLAQVYVESL